MLFPVNLLVLAIAAEACIDNLLWKDTFGWTCRDYTRDPRECRSNYAVSEDGIEAQDACCACAVTLERRRDYQSCLGVCVLNEETCDKECLTQRRECNYECGEEIDSTEVVTAVVSDDSDTTEVVVDPVQAMEWWVTLLIVLGILLCLCAGCVVLYLMCMTRDEGTCEDDECATQQPMLVGGGCDAPFDNPCDNPCDNPGPQITYNPVSAGYSQGQQGQMW